MDFVAGGLNDPARIYGATQQDQATASPGKGMRQQHIRLNRFLNSPVFCIRYHTNNFEYRVCHGISAAGERWERDPFAERVFIAEVAKGQCLVDYRDSTCIDNVRLCQWTTRQ